LINRPIDLKDGEGKVSSLEEAPSQTPPPSTNLFATTSTKDDLKDYTKELRELPGLFAKALHENGEAFKATQKLHSTSHEEKKVGGTFLIASTTHLCFF